MLKKCGGVSYQAPEPYVSVATKIQIQSFGRSLVGHGIAHRRNPETHREVHSIQIILEIHQVHCRLRTNLICGVNQCHNLHPSRKSEPLCYQTINYAPPNEAELIQFTSAKQQRI